MGLELETSSGYPEAPGPLRALPTLTLSNCAWGPLRAGGLSHLCPQVCPA